MSVIKPNTFLCIDGHTCGNPVRLVAGGAPLLKGASQSERRQYFLEHFDWIRTGLMFEPRGHDMMSGSILSAPTREDCDVAILFIETSGCLPMCGHGTIGTVTFAIERGLVQPKEPGILTLDAPAGRVVAQFEQDERGKVTSVRITNVASYLAAEGIKLDCPELGPITIDIAYGGNFYAIIDKQDNYGGLETLKLADILKLSPIIRKLANEAITIAHPEDATISGVSHVMWTGTPQKPDSDGANAVFYGDKAIDRSPCGTGTSARMAQLSAKGLLSVGDDFIHESIIASQFKGRVEATAKVGDLDAIIPSIEGWAIQTGYNTLFLDDQDPFVHGFQVV